MSATPSLLRRVATALAAHAARMLPASRSQWAEAMTHEVEHIGADLEAVTWAAGCVLASYVERSKVMNILRTTPARVLLALVIGTQVLAFLFATALTLAYRLRHLRLAAFLGAFTPGDDYRRLIPLMEATPWWIHAFWVAASGLYFLSGWQLLRDRATAFPAFAAACVIGLVGNLLSQSVSGYGAAFSFPSPSLMRDRVVPMVAALVPALAAAALWAHARRSPPADAGR